MVDDTLIMAAPATVAERDGVSKQAVTKMVRRLAEEHGLPVERDERGRIARFSLAHYDHLRGTFASSAKVSAARSESTESSPLPAPALNMPNSRDEALRQEAWLKVGREKLRRQEEIGQLVRVDTLRQSLITYGREIQAILMRMQNKADDMALAISKEGVHGGRVLFRAIAFEIGNQVADRLAQIALDAPEYDPMIEDEEL